MTNSPDIQGSRTHDGSKVESVLTVAPPSAHRTPGDREELREFLDLVAAWTARSRRARRRIIVKIKRTRTALVVGPVAVAAAAFALSTIDFSAVKSVPPELQGAWGTTQARYADRQFWIATDRVAFQTGPTTKDVSIHRIKGIRLRRVADTAFYTIDYPVDGSTQSWPIAFVAGDRRRIVFVHQPTVVWTPAAGPAWPN